MNRWIAAALASLVLFACGTVEGPSIDERGGNTQEVTKAPAAPTPATPVKVEAYYALRADLRKCPSPQCGGWFIRELNIGSTERYVSGLDFYPSGLGAKDVASVQQAPADTIILKGALGPGPVGTEELLVTEAYLGLPGVTPAVDTVYAVKMLPLDCAACPTLRATLLNTSKVSTAYTLSVKSAALPLVQLDWLEGRVLGHGALVAASVPGSSIDASQVWIRLADLAGPCPPAPATANAPCANGLTQVFTHDANRCLVAAGCVKQGPCPLFTPACFSGYRQVSWPAAPTACPAFACDPEFVTP